MQTPQNQNPLLLGLVATAMVYHHGLSEKKTAE